MQLYQTRWATSYELEVTLYIVFFLFHEVKYLINRLWGLKYVVFFSTFFYLCIRALNELYCTFVDKMHAYFEDVLHSNIYSFVHATINVPYNGIILGVWLLLSVRWILIYM